MTFILDTCCPNYQSPSHGKSKQLADNPLIHLTFFHFLQPLKQAASMLYYKAPNLLKIGISTSIDQRIFYSFTTQGTYNSQFFSLNIEILFFLFICMASIASKTMIFIKSVCQSNIFEIWHIFAVFKISNFLAKMIQKTRFGLSFIQ